LLFELIFIIFFQTAQQFSGSSLEADMHSTTENSQDTVVVIGNSIEARKIIDFAKLAARTDQVILLEGETGVGKDNLAEFIHFLREGKGVFVQVDCGAITSSLFETELFGHRQGAFTGAFRDHKGLVSSADGGVLFLNEVGNVPLHLQSKLLSLIDRKKFRRVGDARDISVNAKIIAATNANLRELVEKGEFRTDLYFRLNVISFAVSPLRVRRSDIPELVEHFLRKMGHRRNFAQSTYALMKEYHWPGNVRELQSVVEKIVFHTRESDLVEPRHVEVHFLPTDTLLRPVKLLSRHERLPTWRELERDYILKLITQSRGDIAEIVKTSGISIKTVYRKVEQFGLQQQLYSIRNKE
jgi:transcriptional regulator with PAS, ATPase and Fis domain